jgi:phosphoribosylamine--glycine ligase
VVLAAAGYPEIPRKGDAIQGLPADNRLGTDVHVFHAGTSEQNHEIVTAGGRVLCVTALGLNLREAHKRAYEAIAAIHWEGMQFRQDIGHHALSR